MSYTNLSNLLINPKEQYVRTNWDILERKTTRPLDQNSYCNICFNGNGSYFLKKHVLARIAHCVLTPFSLLTNLADTTIGIGSGIVSVFTAPLQNKISIFAMNHLDRSNSLLAQPYANLLSAINPNAKTPKNKSLANLEPINVSSSDNFLQRCVVSRLSNTFLATFYLVGKVVCGVIGVLAATLSILTLGKLERINNMAFIYLQAPGIIKDLFHWAIKMVNPGAETQSLPLNSS